MIPPLDPFSLRFDSIEIDPTCTPSTAAFEHALALAAPTAATPEIETSPGFYLLDDAGGRFIVDREIGVVSLKDPARLDSERGKVHAVRMRVIEQSGASYDIDMQLRVTGRVPQMVGADEFTFLADAETPSLTPVSRVALVRQRPCVPWARFTAAQDVGAPLTISGCGAVPYGGMIETTLPAAHISAASLALREKTPAPAPKSAIWSI